MSNETGIIDPRQPITMSSREIAELTGKEHKNVLADIREMLGGLNKAAAEFSATAQITGPNNSKRSVPVFLLPKRETLILVSGYSVELRARIIDRWMELEAGLAYASASNFIELPSDIQLADAKALNAVESRVLKLVESSKRAVLAYVRDHVASYLADFRKSSHTSLITLNGNLRFAIKRVDALEDAVLTLVELSKPRLVSQSIAPDEWYSCATIYERLYG